ncbi:hypothetical protein CPB83DRAFT_859310 [Crepidotus variabilis]|uniref:T6SS Phospholipase effector Tle1-like catalytic domain-containing protein n=1 Tax=Crepidotus variabilis TaxID=179855 RepID=A0A9P6EAM4_9AGAR|nr:hypothetical protein CPB83DRAFT_859310 [Crepidotus variabilis]
MADGTGSEGKSRTLVLCFDGTSNEYDSENTNVVKLYALLKKDNFDEQLCYYQAGIGTYFEPGAVSPLLRVGATLLDYAFAAFLDWHVLDGYKFLMQNYRVGDKICIFGFSRGAYTARALGGLLYKVGLLPRDNFSQVSFAYKMYQREDKEGLRLCSGFKQTYCRSVKIDFMGVWDTVASVGIISGRTLPFTNSNSSIKTFRHALSLDEHRAKFRPNNYHRIPRSKKPSKNDPDHTTPSEMHVQIGKTRNSTTKDNGVVSPVPDEPGEFAKQTGKSAGTALDEAGLPDDVQEVWFVGCHSDVGGGAVSNDTPHSLANISLRWMVREAIKADCGIQFDDDALIRASLDLDPEPSQTEIDMDDQDAMAPIHDELKKHKIWWLLELIPLHFQWQNEDGEWKKDWSCHFGRGRDIQTSTPRFHITVEKRMKAMGYVPKAAWKKGTELYMH